MEETSPVAVPEATATEAKNALPGSYAWRRYFARVFDVGVFLAVLIVLMWMLSIVIVAIANKQDLQAYIAWMRNLNGINRFLDAILTCLLWVPIEAFLLRYFGTTPGKWIFGIQVRTQAGSFLGYKIALSRAVLVLITGQALGVPLISLITLFVSYDRLVKTGLTYWDEELNTTVSYAKLSDGRIALCVIAVALWCVITGWSLVRYIAMQ